MLNLLHAIILNLGNFFLIFSLFGDQDLLPFYPHIQMPKNTDLKRGKIYPIWVKFKYILLFLYSKKGSKMECKVKGCPKKVSGYGYCYFHEYKLREYLITRNKDLVSEEFLESLEE